MGTHQGGDGGNVPPDGDRSPEDRFDLPELPAEWGKITIPDDLSEIAEEAEQIRQELAAGPRPAEPVTPDREPAASTEPSAGMPLVIMSVAVVLTLVSLFAMAWSGSTSAERAGTETEPNADLPRVALSDDTGGQVPVAGQAPAAILLVEACQDCDRLVAATAAAAPVGVTVIAVGQSVPDEPANLAEEDPVPVRLADPYGVLRGELGLEPATNSATVVLVDQHRQITRTVSDVTSVGQFQGALNDLGPS